MSTLAQKVQYLADTKTAIKQAIVDKGVTVQNTDTFRSYAGKISQIDTLHAQQKTVTPTTSQQTITPDTGYNALSQVAVNAVTSEIDSNIAAENIKQGVSILGVEGSMQDMIKVLDGSLETLSIPDSITSIREYAFYKCTMLESVSIPDSVLSIGIDAFAYCANLEHITIPNGITSINASVFYGSGLTGVTIPNSVTQLYNGCFGACANLSTVAIPSGIVYAGVASFALCPNLEYVTLGTGFNANNLNLSSSTKYSTDTIVAMLNALADRTGLSAYTLTLGAVNLAKLTNDQIAVATAKNWNLA